MAKKIQAYIKLQVKAQEANPSPPVGPALGQHGVNIMEFCKAFNAQTQSVEKGLPLPVVITVYSDRSFTFVTKTPPASILLKKAAGIQSGSGRPNTEKVGTVSRAQLEEIAKMKEPDLTAADLDAPVAPRSPWQNAYVERVIGSIRRDVLDHVVVLNERHLRGLLCRYAEYYNGYRTHLGLNKDTPLGRAIQAIGNIVPMPMLGGLHHVYARM